ncbi:MAG: hypothetical protein AAB505_02530 [Patescibacteria group bacterium]
MFDRLSPIVWAAEEIPLVGKVKSEIITPLISFIFALGLVYFLYGVYELVRNSDNEEARATGQRHVLWGVIGMFIMVSFWGIMRLVCRTFGIEYCS